MANEKSLRSHLPDDGRNYGIDLLRIVAMLMIVTLHVLGTGGVLSSAPRYSVKYTSGMFFELASYGGVNLFAVIMGYVNYGRKTKYARLIQICIQILFYTLTTTALFRLVSPGKVTGQTVVYALLPFKIGGYWYFAAYFCLFFFMPYINLLVEKLDRKSAAVMLTGGFLVFSVLPTLLYQDIGGLRNGYSAPWLAMMALCGACLRRFDCRLAWKYCLSGYFLCVAASLAGKLMIEKLTAAFTGEAKYGHLFVSYISPLIVMSSVFLFLLFKDLKLKKPVISFVKFFAPMTFGVYLIHMEPLIKETFIEDRFGGYAEMNTPLMLVWVFLTVGTIWLVCSLIDRLRTELFRLLKIPALCARLENAMRKGAARIASSRGTR